MTTLHMWNLSKRNDTETWEAPSGRSLLRGLHMGPKKMARFYFRIHLSHLNEAFSLLARVKYESRMFKAPLFQLPLFP